MMGYSWNNMKMKPFTIHVHIRNFEIRKLSYSNFRLGNFTCYLSVLLLTSFHFPENDISILLFKELLESKKLYLMEQDIAFRCLNIQRALLTLNN